MARTPPSRNWPMAVNGCAGNQSETDRGVKQMGGTFEKKRKALAQFTIH
jgi:hypothetical protein